VRIIAVNLVFALLLVALRVYVFPERALLQLAIAIPVAVVHSMSHWRGWRISVKHMC
jgi:hypothetical protein